MTCPYDPAAWAVTPLLLMLLIAMGGLLVLFLLFVIDQLLERLRAWRRLHP